MTCSVLLRIGDAPQGVCHGHDRGEHYHNPDDPEDRFHHGSRYKSVSRCGLVAASPPNAKVKLQRGLHGTVPHEERRAALSASTHR